MPALFIAAAGFICAPASAADPWKELSEMKNKSEEILSATMQDITVPESYTCNCEIKGDLSDKLKEIIGSKQDVIVKKYFRQRGNVCDVKLYSETKEGKTFESDDLKTSLAPVNVMLKRIAPVERLNVIADITFISYFKIEDLKKSFNATLEKTTLNGEKMRKLTLSFKYPEKVERSYVNKWILWSDKKKLLRKMYIEKIIVRKVNGTSAEDKVVTDAEYVYSKFGRHNLPVEVMQAGKKLRTTISYTPKEERYLISSMDFFEQGEKKTTMKFTYKGYDGYFMPVEMQIAGKESAKMTCDYIKVGDYYLPGYETFTFENLAPSEVKYSEFEIDNTTPKESFENRFVWQGQDGISFGDFLEQSFAGEDETR
jgi:hypothetical protein